MYREQPSDQVREYPKFRNDRATSHVRIGTREFNCIGVSPPHDHPHIYLNMGAGSMILCPYCSTAFHFDPCLGPSEADPQDSVYTDPGNSDPPISGTSSGGGSAQIL
jgi:uncharacterized Zn-finger protein